MMGDYIICNGMRFDCFKVLFKNNSLFLSTIDNCNDYFLPIDKNDDRILPLSLNGNINFFAVCKSVSPTLSLDIESEYIYEFLIPDLKHKDNIDNKTKKIMTEPSLFIKIKQ